MDEQEGQAGVKPGSETTETPTSYTPEQLEKAVEKAARDARTAVMADVGRTKAEAERALKAAKDATERLQRLQKEQEEAELESVRDEPDALSAIRARHNVRRLTAELDAKNAELEISRGQISEFSNKEREATKQTIAQKVASSYSVDSQLLSKLAKFTDGTEESIESIAKDLPKLQKSSQGYKPDSNRSRGVTSQTVQEIQREFISGKTNSELYAEKMRAMGVQP